MTEVRAQDNPLIGPLDVRPSQEGFEIIGTFNPAVARLGDEVVLLVRVAERPRNDDPNVVLAAIFDVTEGRIVTQPFARDDPANGFSDPRLIVRNGQTYLTSISHLRLARSTDGLHFDIEDRPTIAPSDEYETFGIEDPRITCIDGVHYIHYVAVSPLGVATVLVSTRDFRTFERHGVIFAPENKDVAIFPGPIKGTYSALHRPHSPLFGRNDIWLAQSPDLFCWGNHRHLIGTREGLWDERRIGAGAPPVRIDEGWLEIYHGADRHNRYCLGALLLDADEPWKVRARSDKPILVPEAEYECSGFFGHVVFTCGLLCEDKRLKLYYGAADTTVCHAEIPVPDVLATLTSC
ncbi:MAG: glycoside hydrolase family 130 protein [Sedimentisphaerales bacterium]|nr:glycoside hydrolase family 130 protein [Sedimentisphaerales bacterium]